MRTGIFQPLDLIVQSRQFKISQIMDQFNVKYVIMLKMRYNDIHIFF